MSVITDLSRAEQVGLIRTVERNFIKLTNCSVYYTACVFINFGFFIDISETASSTPRYSVKMNTRQMAFDYLGF